MSTTAELNPALTSPLALLLLDRGFTFQQVSQAVPDCSFTLLCRIALARQPFPLDLAREVGALVGVDSSTLIAATGLWTANSGPATRVPVPPDLLRGDPLLPSPSHPTQPLVFPPPPPPVPLVCVVGAGLGTSGLSGMQGINRNTGLVAFTATFLDVKTPVEVASNGSTLWAFGSQPSGPTAFFAVVDPATGTIVAESDSTLNDLMGLAFEPVTSTFWTCPTTDTAVYRFNEFAVSNPDALVMLTDGGDQYRPRDVLALGGLLYVTAVHPTGNGGQPWKGRIFEVDPSTQAILRVSTGTDLGNVQGICADDAGNLWTVSRAGGGAITPMLARTPATSFASAQVPLIGDPSSLTDPQWVEFLFGSLWVSDSTTPNGRLFQADAGGNVLQSRTFAGGSAVGHVAADGKFLWYADKAAGLLHMLHPGDISFTPFQVVVGGAPDGLVVV